jgi:hypothetical protein
VKVPGDRASVGRRVMPGVDEPGALFEGVVAKRREIESVGGVAAAG